MTASESRFSLKNLSIGLWKGNLLLVFFYLFLIAGPGYFKSSVLEFSNITSDPFDGTVYPVTYIPNWAHSANQNKSLNFSDIDVGEFVALPKYDLSILQNSDTKNAEAWFDRYTYITLYMGSYRMNYEEEDGSHCGIDIRVPLGTPVMSIANGVVVKAVDADSSNGKYVVIRHDNVTLNGTKETLYSSYLHMSSVSVVAGDKIAKGAIIGKSGMTGTATTPHLHFQIDKGDLSYHPYWPYTYREAADLGLDFFSAINVGLGKEKAMQYTTHPLNFVQNNLASQDSFFDSDTDSDSSATSPTPESTPTTSPVVSQETTPQTSTVASSSATVTPTPVATPAATTISAPEDTLSSAPQTPTIPDFYTDVSKTAKYTARLKEFVKNKVVTINETGYFFPDGALLRKDAAIILARLYNF